VPAPLTKYKEIAMPFQSKSQMRWMYATHPRMAKRWTKEQEKAKGKKSFKALPEKKKKRSRDEFCLFQPMLEVFDE
jgi:hypothetical protein